LDFAISFLCVIIFTALTAYDTQNIKEMYAESHGTDANSRMALMGALSLYLNFINIFMSLLNLLGERE
jgi:FtsH-binding integral membrane protein